MGGHRGHGVFFSKVIFSAELYLQYESAVQETDFEMIMMITAKKKYVLNVPVNVQVETHR